MSEYENLIKTLFDGADAVYLSSVDEDGFPVTRAMLPPRKREGCRVFYLTTNTSSKKVAEFACHPEAGLYAADVGHFRGVYLAGKVEVLHDRPSKEMIWQEGDTLYYPKGIDDPDYCVLKFSATKGRSYGNFNPKSFTLED